MQLYQITLSNLRRRMIKVFFVLLGLIIGIGTIVSVNGIVEAMKTEMTKQVSEFGVNVVVTPDAGGLTFSYGGITLPEIMYDVEQLTTDDLTAIEEVATRDMIRVIAPKLMGVDLLENGLKVIVVGANLQQEFLVKPWLRIVDNTMGKSEASPENTENKKMDFEALDLSRQDIEALVLRDDQLLIGSTLAKTLGVKEGDILSLSNKDYEVFALLKESGTSEDGQILMNLSSAQELLGREGEITIIEMAVDYFLGSEEALLSDLNRILPHGHITSLRQETLRRDDMLTRLVRFGMSISVLILLVGMLVVGLTISGSVRERTREIGVFRALGFRKTHIAKMILLEGVIISVIGGIIGFFGGTVMAQYMGPLFAGMDIQVPWRIDLLLMAVLLAVFIGVISSLYPAYQAAKQDPVEALRFI